MKVAGLGFRNNASVASLREALDAAGGPNGLAAVATVSDKVGAVALQALAQELGLPIRGIPAAMLAEIETATQSELINARFGTGSVAEAAAVAAAGSGARLISARAVSQDRMATAAIAEGDGE
ncbi:MULTISPECIES: cobalamin biosynthesis protein [unclassified Bradyrhizobium]|uniref:cobalamin biosynthesis protein n=1 Tax=unclassified Bradyrhizobium TaxID=2631580 RepID=UPI001BAAB591|nr:MULTISPECIES: cobalamin biosynthesis protein [unclassified Bradyrhizobium]MBR1202540.1 cobalamin biosynthesis protein [Bradyrhizobium sp. AUGA SZCCT0124]MBR1310891.1 cobalamin biosynthesis protein [Bradyrhizobium sp. AUGA SZCCT0051]MBR1339489.1 cobalamin biosynthesis protein [Bradyrhizobium sp. AUGA SZCCT0105]MBR1354063.1 cobalamin biosynthesis protein [Bradyrhizobium sp. AUGA SZCCT0045]